MEAGSERARERYTVRLEKQSLVFSAAHFITFNGNVCERLHGHNYGVWAEVTGELDDNHYVVDFIALRDTLKELVDALDHHVLLPMQHPLIQVRDHGREVEARFEDRRWVFPREDCVLLPVANTTAELLAQFLGRQLLETLDRRVGFRPVAAKLAVDENRGQWAIWETTLRENKQ